MPTTGQRVRAGQAGTVFAGDSLLEVMVCPICGVIYAAPSALIEYSRGAPHRNFYCPAGHQLHFPGKTEEEKLKDQLERERDWRANVQARLDQTEADLRGTKAAKSRFKNERDALKKRTTAGICPHPECHRHFENVARHVANKHPELLTTE